jgi:inner membrane protein
MDNLTHSLVGLAAAKAGLERLSPGATTLCVLAANAPDADVAVGLFSDRWGLLQHHRGITHSIVGVLILAVLLPLLFYAGDFIICKLKRRSVRAKFGGLLLASVIASFTHPVLDWTNNYGIRLLLPWNPRWFYGDFVFIVDPFIWLILGSACFLLTSTTRFRRIAWLGLGTVLTVFIMLSPRGGNLPHPWLVRCVWLALLIGLIVLFKNNVGKRFGFRVALTSFVLLGLYWGALSFAHSQALLQGRSEAQTIIRPGESITRLAAMPTLANAFGWDCVFETDQATYRFKLKLLSQDSVSHALRFEKPTGQLDRALKEVSGDRRTQIFLGFARFPVAQLSGSDCSTQTLVQLADLRYTEPGASRGNFSLELPVDCAQPITTNR